MVGRFTVLRLKSNKQIYGNIETGDLEPDLIPTIFPPDSTIKSIEGEYAYGNADTIVNYELIKIVLLAKDSI